MNEPYYCPVNGWDCPYYDANGVCMMDDPITYCDDAAAMEACLNDDSDNIYIFGAPVLDPFSTFKSKYIKSWRVGEPLREEDFYEEDE